MLASRLSGVGGSEGGLVWRSCHCVEGEPKLKIVKVVLKGMRCLNML